MLFNTHLLSNLHVLLGAFHTYGCHMLIQNDDWLSGICKRRWEHRERSSLPECGEMEAQDSTGKYRGGIRIVF